MTFTEGVPLGESARAFIPQLQRAGYSANGALEFLRGQGAGMRRDTFLRAWGEVARDLAGQPGMVDRSLTELIGEQDMATWSAGRAGHFGYEVHMLLRDKATGLLRTATTWTFTPNNITPLEAVSAAQQAFEANEQNPAYQTVFEGAYFTQAYRMLGR